MRKSVFVALPLLLLNQNSLHVHAQSNSSVLYNDDDLVCVDLADFFYEIILGVSTFPNQGDCSEREEAEIAAFLQKRINGELDSMPGTLSTHNKVCGNPINNRRRLLVNSTVPRSFLRSLAGPEREKERDLLVRGRRSFIYVGGGRCRYCFYDNDDKRDLLFAATKELSLAATTGGVHNNTFALHDNKKGARSLMFTVSMQQSSYQLPKVADASFCKSAQISPFLARHGSGSNTKNVVWTNEKTTSFTDREPTQKRYTDKELLGLYVAGDRFGAQGNAKDILRQRIAEAKLISTKTDYKTGEPLVPRKLPVREGIIHFRFWAFDLPTEYSTGMLDDNPFYLFINGVKLDFNLFLSEPGTQVYVPRGTPFKLTAKGTSFAGIKWTITLMRDGDFAYSPKRDRMYYFRITVPLIVFAHKNQLDVDFMIKPNAKAKHYAFSRLRAALVSVNCEVTGLENSPFEDFKSAVESRLFHKLGVDLAREFQSKEGHCMHNKIPVVDVHLVEKQDWKESNPKCN